MSVPIHNLYELIHQLTENRALVYYFSDGSRKISDILQHLHKLPSVGDKPFKKNLPGLWHDYKPVVLCHDQEPLDFLLYNDKNLNNFNNFLFDSCYKDWWNNVYKIEKNVFSNLNLRFHRADDWTKYTILLHSELNSEEVFRYEQSGKFLCAFYWSHALLARDWYRFAEFDKRLEKKDHSKKLFLCYALGKDGTRNYRNKFLKYCTEIGIDNHLQTKSFLDNGANSDYSAIYDSYDMANTDLSVVLETIFDNRIHLTEKTLRPIACGHPFIIANGPGSLQFIRKYGFKTFHPYINESYDLEVNNDKRLTMIINEMHRLTKLTTKEKQQVFNKIQKIAEHNKKIFFSKAFLQDIIQELDENLNRCLDKAEHQMDWKFKWQVMKNIRKEDPSRVSRSKWKSYIQLLQHLKKGGTLENYVPPDLD